MAVALDAWSHKVVGWAMETLLREVLVGRALEMAVRRLALGPRPRVARLLRENRAARVPRRSRAFKDNCLSVLRPPVASRRTQVCRTKQGGVYLQGSIQGNPNALLKAEKQFRRYGRRTRLLVE